MSDRQKQHSTNGSHGLRRGSRVAMQSISDGVIVTNNQGIVEFLNPAAETLSGWRLTEAASQPIDTVVELHEELTGERVSGTGIWEAPKFDKQNVGRCTLKSKSGDQRLINANISPVVDQDGSVTGTVMVIKDLSEENGLLEKLDYQSTHDALTGLVNRTVFEKAILDLHRQTVPITSENAVVYIDVDQFKIINDTCGHAAGDLFLKTLSRKLEERVRENDVLARLGGDEFGVLLKGCSLRHARLFAEEICHLVSSMRFVWNGQIYRHTASLGVTAIGGQKDVAAILSAADVACFTAKDSGRNKVHVYHDGKVPSRHVEMQWVARISRALDEERMMVFQQPIVPISDSAKNSWPHYELLVRMTDRFGQVILPKYFIGAAERYNLMPRIDRWMISKVLSKLVWRKQLAPAIAPYTVSLNLSGTSLSDDDFMTFLETELDRFPIVPGTLCFEITETATISNIAHVAEFMRRLKKRGCRFSLDDFGSGLSSFAYLKELPVDLIKIEGDFVRDVLSSPADAAVVDAINRVGVAMNIRTVAERVDSAELLSVLRDMGVDYAQGFYFAEPREVRNRSSFITSEYPEATASA